MPETIYTASQRYDRAISAGLIVITWGVSRAKDHWGETLVTLTQYPAPPDTQATRPPAKRYRCRGGNYDMRGTVLGQFITDYFRDGLKRLSSAEFYGLYFWSRQGPRKPYRKHVRYHEGDEIVADGSCGWSCMQGILRALGFDLVRTHASHNREVYELRAL